MKRFFLKLISLAFAFTLCAPVLSAFPKREAAAEAEKTIDVYVIAGQSNAVGYSNVSSVDTDRKKPEYQTGFDNLYFRGRSEWAYHNGYDVPVKFGQGQNADRFGAEVGIADTLQPYYTDASGKKAIIVKYSAGGTYLTDNTKHNFTQTFGNWCPPSKISQSSTGQSGILFAGLVNTITETVSYYEQAGYTVALKGTFWMQGEAETDGTFAQYGEFLTAFINDYRERCVTVFDTDNAALAPFIIGKIAPTFNGGNGTNVQAVRNLQEQGASALNAVYCVETEDYIIVDPSTNQPATGCYDRYHFNGNDMLSLGQEVGKAFLFGNSPRLEVKITKGEGTSSVYMQELKGEPIEVVFTPAERYYLGKLYKDEVDVTSSVVDGKYVVTDTEGIHLLKAEFWEEPNVKTQIVGEGRASVSYAALTGEPIEITFTPEKHHSLKKLTKINLETNGETDVTAEVENGRFIFTETDGRWVLKAEFAENEKYALKITHDKEKGSVSKNPAAVKYYAGVEVKISVDPERGYAVKSVTFNGEKITASQGYYTVTITEGAYEFVVEYESVQQEQTPPAGGEPSKDSSSSSSSSVVSSQSSGCGAGLGGGFAALTVFGAVMIAVKKRRL